MQEIHEEKIRKCRHCSTTGTAVMSYKPQVLNTNDYYSFGSPVKKRTYNTLRYRYGFNAKENIN